MIGLVSPFLGLDVPLPIESNTNQQRMSLVGEFLSLYVYHMYHNPVKRRYVLPIYFFNPSHTSKFL